MKNFSKKYSHVILVYAIVFLCLNVLYFIIPFTKTSASWVAYAFMNISIIVSFLVTYKAFMENNIIKSKVYSLPAFRIGVIYFAFQLIFCIIMFIIGCFYELAVWIPVAISIVIFSVALIGVIGAFGNKKAIEVQEENEKNAIKQMTYFKLDISSILAKCDDGDLKKVVKRLNEEFKYSDPVSSEATVEAEEKMKVEIEQLKALVSTDISGALTKAEQISNMLSERNNICKAMK